MASSRFSKVWYLPEENRWRDMNLLAMRDTGTLVVAKAQPGPSTPLGGRTSGVPAAAGAATAGSSGTGTGRSGGGGAGATAGSGSIAC